MKDIYRGQERLNMIITRILERILGNSSSLRGTKTPQPIIYDRIKKTDSRKYQLFIQKLNILKIPSFIKFSTKPSILPNKSNNTG